MKEINITTKSNSKLSITERVKTFEDACEVLGIDGTILIGTIDDALADDSDSIIAYTKLVIIIKALNEGWKPNWNASDEYKHYPWFDLEKGFGLYSVICNCTDSGVGSRLCFRSRELAKYASEQFIDLYKDYYIIK